MDIDVWGEIRTGAVQMFQVFSVPVGLAVGLALFERVIPLARASISVGSRWVGRSSFSSWSGGFAPWSGSRGGFRGFMARARGVHIDGMDGLEAHAREVNGWNGKSEGGDSA